MLKLLKPKTGENVGEKIEEETENETRNFYTPTKSVRTNSTQNDDPSTSSNSVLRQRWFGGCLQRIESVSFLTYLDERWHNRDLEVYEVKKIVVVNMRSGEKLPLEWNN